MEDAEDYEDLRFRLGVAEGPEMSIPSLEFNLDRLNGLAFERMRRTRIDSTYLSGVVRKRCMPCTIRNESQELSEDSPRNIRFANQEKVSDLSIRNNSKDEASLGLAMIRQEHLKIARRFEMGS